MFSSIWRGTRGAAAVAAMLGSVLAASCIRTTPFQSDPSVTGVTAKNLTKLDARQPAPGAFKVAALGDTHTDYDNLQITIEAINARDDIAFVLIAGDMTNNGLLQEFEWVYDVYRRLDVPFFTVIGNHDTLGHGASIYRDMYGPYDYSFRYVGTKFVLFNSNTLEFEGDAPNRDWLTAQVLDRRDSESVVLVAHHDLTSPADYPDGTAAEFYEGLVQLDGVSGVVHGHNVSYELTEWHGVPVLQCGTYEHLFLHTIVTIDGPKLSFEVCSFDHCEPVVPSS
jgi:3',5'-cyclic AMP phosphodiesterase CpdA